VAERFASGAPFAEASREGPWPAARRLLLVPCHRPADALTTLDWSYTAIPKALLTAILRSWEERFGAVLVQLEPSAVALSVGAPPAERDQALDLARELTAIARDNPDPGALSALADMLLTGRHTGDSEPPLQALGSTTMWRFSFREESPDTLDALVIPTPT
jgi:hypothetical protein